MDSIVNNGIHFNGIFIRNGDTTGMESSGIYGENQFYRIAGSPKKWPVPAEKSSSKDMARFPGPPEPLSLGNV